MRVHGRSDHIESDIIRDLLNAIFTIIYVRTGFICKILTPPILYMVKIIFYDLPTTIKIYNKVLYKTILDKSFYTNPMHIFKASLIMQTETLGYDSIVTRFSYLRSKE